MEPSVWLSISLTRAQVLNLSRYFSLSPNRILTHLFCTVKIGESWFLDNPPHTDIPKLRCDWKSVLYNSMYISLGTNCMILHNLPVQLRSFVASCFKCADQFKFSSMITPKKRVSETFLITFPSSIIGGLYIQLHYLLCYLD